MNVIIEEKPIDAAMARDIKRLVAMAHVDFNGARRALELDVALEAVIQGRMVVVPRSAAGTAGDDTTKTSTSHPVESRSPHMG